jgi:prevent-host-death family protein
MGARWTVQEAKARLSEVLRRARAGEPQTIGHNNGCVVVSEEAWAERSGETLGEWLVHSAPRGVALPPADRGSRRSVPFDEEP